MRHTPSILIFILLVLFVSNPASVYSQSFNPSSNKQETIKFIDNLLKKSIGTWNGVTVYDVSFNENGYKGSDGNDTKKNSYEYTSIPWENVQEITKYRDVTYQEITKYGDVIYVDFRYPFKGVLNNKIGDDQYVLWFTLPGSLSSYTNDLETALNHLVSLSKNEKGVSTATLEETLSYIKTRLNAYQTIDERFKATLFADRGIEKTLTIENYSNTVIAYVSIYFKDLKAIELLQGNIVLSGKIEIYGNPATRPSDVTIYLSEQMSTDDKQKLLKAFKHIAYLKRAKLFNNDRF